VTAGLRGEGRPLVLRWPLTRARYRSPDLSPLSRGEVKNGSGAILVALHLAPRERGEVGRAAASPGEGPTQNKTAVAPPPGGPR
jgi:hypothetical protein